MTTKLKDDNITSAEDFADNILKNVTLGELFRSIRKSEELSIAELALRIGVSKQFLSDVERNKKQVGIPFIKKFTSELGYGAEPLISIFLKEELLRSGLDYDIAIIPKKAV